MILPTFTLKEYAKVNAYGSFVYDIITVTTGIPFFYLG